MRETLFVICADNQQLGTAPQSNSTRVDGSIVKLLSLVTIFTIELLALTVFFDTGRLSHDDALVSLFRTWGADVLRAILTSVTVYAIFVSFSKTTDYRELADRFARARFSWPTVAAHAGSMAAMFVGLEFLQKSPQIAAPTAILVGCLVAGCVAMLAGVLALVPAPVLINYVRSTLDFAFFPAAISGIVTLLFESIARPVWNVASFWTFNAVGFILGLGRSDVVIDPANLTVGTKAFQVRIVAACSGLEGAALMLVFAGLWLWYFRAEHRFPLALLTVPAGVLVAWCFNAVRITALILIGDAGAEQLAMGGFHSQAGWIAWTAVALTFVVVLQRMNVLRTYPRQTGTAADNHVENPTAWYIGPFLIILAASILAHAGTQRPEMLYPVRLLGPALVLLWFRRHYRILDWRLTRATPIAGLAVAAMWLGFDALQQPTPSTVQPQIAALPQTLAFAWIVARIIGSAIIVPVAEELAFRAFLMRRLAAEDFEAVDPRTAGFIAIGISSLVFGLFHGGRVIEATLAGILYALAYGHHGRFGDAVGAHAVTNAVLTIVVLTRGAWDLW